MTEAIKTTDTDMEISDRKAIRDLVDRETGNRRVVRYWLYFICFMVFVMVIVGGATRLTDSGLSITEWEPIHGVIPPLSEAQWEEELEKYRQIPEYQKINKGMSLDEFKFIYWWEWGHRLLGRLIGVAFFVPLVVFWARGQLEPMLKPRLVLLLFLGGLQGFIGWWMVKSGLVNRVDVSQYRLAVHLTLACIIFAYAMWIARGLAPHSVASGPQKLKTWGSIVLGFIFIQVFMGGLVAGMDAGLAFNDWPTMDGAIIPIGLTTLEPFWLNWFENPKSVQFNHRIGGYVLLALALAQMVVALGMTADPTHKRRTVVVFALVVLQALIGIITLVMQVPMFWALVHQGGAVVVIGFAVAHLRALKGEYPRHSAIQIGL